MRLLSYLVVLLLVGAAQAQTLDTRHFAKDGLSFDYPSDFLLRDENPPNGQHLILTQGEHGAQIMVFSRYAKLDSPEQIAHAREELFDSFVDSMAEGFKRQETKVERIEAKTEIAAQEASGVKLRAVLGGEPGNAEAYYLLLGRRLVVVTLIGADTELSAAAPAWKLIRSSLRVE